MKIVRHVSTALLAVTAASAIGVAVLTVPPRHTPPAAAAVNNGVSITDRGAMNGYVAALTGTDDGHTTSEIQRAAQSWVDRGLPYDQLTPASQALVSASTWRAWAACGHGYPGVRATDRGHGNDLAVVRFTWPNGDRIEWTAFYRHGRWTFDLPGSDVAYLRTHTAAQVSRCE